MLDALPPCCAAANDLVRRTRRDLTCDCGERYLYDERTAERPALVPEAPAVEQVAPRRPSMPGAQRDARVQVARDYRPGDTGRFVRAAFSDDAVLRLARLLDELQVDVGDAITGVAWAPPSPVAAQRYDRVVVQSSAREPSGPDLSALLGVVEDARPTVEDTIELRAAGDVTVASVLRWLRANGDRAAVQEDGRAELTRIYGAIGYLYASEKARAKYDADERVRAEAAPVKGRELLISAMEAWWR